MFTPKVQEGAQEVRSLVGDQNTITFQSLDPEEPFLSFWLAQDFIGGQEVPCWTKSSEGILAHLKIVTRVVIGVNLDLFYHFDLPIPILIHTRLPNNFDERKGDGTVQYKGMELQGIVAP